MVYFFIILFFIEGQRETESHVNFDSLETDLIDKYIFWSLIQAYTMYINDIYIYLYLYMYIYILSADSGFSFLCLKKRKNKRPWTKKREDEPDITSTTTTTMPAASRSRLHPVLCL